MTGGKEGRKARAFDFDDTLIDRGKIVRSVGLVAGLLKAYELSSVTLADISRLDFPLGRVDSFIERLKGRISFAAHARKRVYPGVRDELEKIAADGTAILGNTGRPNKREWIAMTEQTLDRAGIRAYFTDIFYTPEGVPTAVSKAQVILTLTQAYENVEFDEDDPGTALLIARLFPNVQVNLVQHGLTGLLVSSRELAELPNLKRVVVLGKK